MHDDIDRHVAAVEAAYRPLVTGSRLEHGDKLWRQFDDAVRAYRTLGMNSFPAVIERVNELAVAKFILNDPTLAQVKISYEPQIAASGRRIDFVIPDVEGRHLYIEVKTVRPTSEDNDPNWNKYLDRSCKHTENTNYLVAQPWRGAQIYTDSFSARGKFLCYALEFEDRLTETVTVQPGRGILVFCGTGMEWHRSELEDFADFYLTGKHRQDDPFAKMEAYEIAKSNRWPRGNISAFGFMKRAMNSTAGDEWIANIRGPRLFR